MNLMIRAVCLTAICVVGLAGTADKKLKQIVAGDQRSDAASDRDQYRHPIETLTFFGLTDDMTVVEIWPGGSAWYMEILAPYLKDDGTYYAASFDKDLDSNFIKKAAAALDQKIAGDPESYGKVNLTEFSANKTEIAPTGSADMVLTFRNVHNWMASGYADTAFAAFYKALKPGGVLGLVEHRAPADGEQDPKAQNGYVQQDYVIEMAKKAGFELVATSEVNANPNDTKNHPNGVWTLPPTFALGDTDHDSYAKIGESDRMTLLFKKPE